MPTASLIKFDTKTAKIHTEKEILLKGSKWSMRINRLILMPQKTIIINYLSQNQDLTILKKQLKSCSTALEKMNFENIERYLLDIDNEKVLKL